MAPALWYSKRSTADSITLFNHGFCGIGTFTVDVKKTLRTGSGRLVLPHL